MAKQPRSMQPRSPVAPSREVRTVLGTPPRVPKAAGGDGQLAGVVGDLVGRGLTSAKRRTGAPPA
eukprot:8416027-Alexandrium_andersonii.AAC.1